MMKFVFVILLFATICNAQEFTIFNKTNSDLLSNSVKAVTVDNNNNKYFGTDKGLSTLFGDATWGSLTTADGLASDWVTDVMPDISRADSSILDVATDAGISRIYVNSYDIDFLYNITEVTSDLVLDSVRCVAINSNGVHWYGTPEGCSTVLGDQWHLFNSDNYDLISNDVTDIASPDNDWTFVASRSDGVSRVKRDVDGVTGASEISTDWHGIASNNVSSVLVDHLGKRWFGTDKGVSMQFGDQFRKNWTTFTTDSGLIDNNVTAICEDRSGVMWFGTSAGLSSFDGQNWNSYTTTEGLSGNVINDLAVGMTGDIWIATDNGVTMLKPGYIKRYVVKKTDEPITIDGELTEQQWQDVEFTDIFVDQETGNGVKWGTKAKLLWDDQYLYVGFLALDDDVWGERTAHDSYLWKEEPVEFFCDPNDDSKNYFEIEINPLNTQLDLAMDKPYSDGGTGDFNWNVTGLLSAVSINGTLNDPSDIDSAWYCEMAIPFSAIDAVMTNPLSNPPTKGDEWRVQLARYNRERDSEGNLISGGTETSCWNATENPSFHVPEKFGRIIFSDEMATVIEQDVPKQNLPVQISLLKNYPNPFNPVTTISFNVAHKAHVELTVYNILGEKVRTLVNKELTARSYKYQFDGSGLSSGLYFYKLQIAGIMEVKKMMMLK